MAQFVPGGLRIDVYHHDTDRYGNATWSVPERLQVSGKVLTAIGEFQGDVQLTPDECDQVAALMEQIVERIDRELNEQQG